MVEHVLAKDETRVRFSLAAQNLVTQNTKNLIQKVPKEVSHVTETLEKAGFEAYLVGGCVRGLLMDKEPKDWDVTTNAKPEQIIGFFPETVYENKFGTVVVIQEDVIHETSRQIEVTPYRVETKYSDFRHPDEVRFSEKLDDDLKRRDFTVNAMALRTSSAEGGSASGGKGQLVDLFNGVKDIQSKTLRTVGRADNRFTEDALRMIRAVRFACQLNFSVSQDCVESIIRNSILIKKVSAERIRDEFVKIIMSENSASGIVMLHKFNLLKNIIPELEEGINCEQLGQHIYDVWEHLLHALQHATDKNLSLEIRLSALFHDIGKPKTRRIASQAQQNFVALPASGLRHEQNFSIPATQKHLGLTQKAKPASNLAWSGDFFRGPDKLLAGGATKKKYTFYGHEVVGARMAKKIMERLKFPNKKVEIVEKLVRNHMFFSDTELITLSAVRRIITKVGKENIWTLMNVRECDRVGMKKKETPYRLRKYFAMIEEALRDPISVGQLKIDGEFMIKELNITPGPRMGWILHALLEEILDAPEKNTVEHLSELVKSLNMLGDAELKTLGERGKEKKEELEEEEITKLHEKHGVRK